KTCTGKDYWYYGWCEKTGVLSLSFADFDYDGLYEGAAIVIRSHEPDADIKGTFAFGVQSDAYLLIYESDGSVHERLIARCFDSRASFLDVYLINGRFYVETGSRIETDTVRTYGVYEWTGSDISIPVLISGTGDIKLTLTDNNAGAQFFPADAYSDGHDGYMSALSHRLECYGLSGGEFGSLEKASFSGGVRMCLASGGISGSPGMKLTGKCDCSLMSQFIGYGHNFAADPIS
ncbi:MAG: hypothetical protein J6S41_04530, partial [Clostridia bacterium]|nr:hypothetical protein [Clostridia bacterium]